ncbi:HAMP domain-containing sensor histidine kinase [Gracilibacillus phocaeensis]|uniref:HAMP domain-containing sensor histidine kinase n=1 Tax=Gracilibacillus phocaeensis TaxID=2042304 RepID=UPI002570A2B9|nr:HAMP domain-containing sensor histidine kinase [Gracilibacillus phocaeensis]
MQTYWTTWYLVSLVIGLAIVAVVSALWIRHNTLENRLNIMEFMAEETADRIANISEADDIPPNFDQRHILDNPGRFMDIEGNPTIYVTDMNGRITDSNLPPHRQDQLIDTAVLESNETVQNISTDNGVVYVIKKAIQTEEEQLGWVFYLETKANLSHVNQQYGQLILMIISLLIIGWCAIYFLTGKLTKPMKEVAHAAKQIEQGNYQVTFHHQAKEKEVADVIQSFQEMSQKLENLEALRTELLAGVSHELKTPITSINGLLKAIQDGVVEDKEEVSEFLNMSVKETDKMSRMVEDLLDFNKFAAGAISVAVDTYLLRDLFVDVMESWSNIPVTAEIQVELQISDEDLTVDVDPIRFAQIVTNLLNNAVHAMKGKGTIQINVHHDEQKVNMDVKDSGLGIPSEEQPYIFERFYRGELKKQQVGGLGLGLPFSRMVARAMNGDLFLVNSSSAGTTFCFTLPRLK